MFKFALLFLFLMTGVAHAEVKILYDKTTKEVFTIVRDGDNPFIPPAKVNDIVSATIKGNKEDLALTYPVEYYVFNGKDIKLNRKKIDDEDAARDLASKKQVEFMIVQNKALKTACDQLKTDGVAFNCEDFK